MSERKFWKAGFITTLLLTGVALDGGAIRIGTSTHTSFHINSNVTIETADAYYSILKSFTNPSVIALTRQNLPVINRNQYNIWIF